MQNNYRNMSMNLIKKLFGKKKYMFVPNKEQLIHICWVDCTDRRTYLGDNVALSCHHHSRS